MSFAIGAGYIRPAKGFSVGQQAWQQVIAPDPKNHHIPHGSWGQACLSDSFTKERQVHAVGRGAHIDSGDPSAGSRVREPAW